MNNTKRYFSQVTNFFDSALGSQIKYYAFFYFVLWSFHLILISLVSYFHLLLNHNIRTIGDWIGDRGWVLIITSKVLIFYIAFQFIRLKTKKINFVRGYFRNSVQMPRKEIVASLLFLILGFTGMGQVKLNSIIIFEFSRMFFSVLGTIIFFAVDYALLIILEIFYPIHAEGKRTQKLFLFPLLFYLFTYATFIYEQSVSIKLYGYFFLLLYLGEWRRKNWTLPLLYLLAFLVPVYSFFGLDPVWGSNYSFFLIDKNISSFSHFILIGTAILYLHFNQENNPEYIYRD